METEDLEKFNKKQVEATINVTGDKFTRRGKIIKKKGELVFESANYGAIFFAHEITELIAL